MMVFHGNHNGGGAVPGPIAGVDINTAHPPRHVVTTSAGCCAAPGASPAVNRVRRTAIVIIIFHAIALAAIGFFFWVQWIASLAGIIMASVLLCVFNKCCYITAAIIFAIGAIFDIYAMVVWISLAQAFDEAGESSTYYSYTDDVDATTDTWGAVAGGLAVPPAIAALTMFLGSVFAVIAVMNWSQSGAHDAPPIVIHEAVRVGATGAAIRDPNYPYPASTIGGQNPPPPAYPA